VVHSTISQKWLVGAHYRASDVDKRRQLREVTNAETTHQL